MRQSLGQPEAAPLPGVGAKAGTPAAAQRSGADRGRLARLIAYLDVILVIVATVPALVLGAPAFGFLVGAIAWLLQRLLAHLDRVWIGRRREPRTQLGLNLFEAFGRIWLLAGAIVLAGVAGDRADGLTAALTIFGAYSAAFVVRILSGPPRRPGGAASAPTRRSGLR
jgi:hypothetical protein